MKDNQKKKRDGIQDESYKETIQKCLVASRNGVYVYRGSPKQYSTIGCDEKKRNLSMPEKENSCKNNCTTERICSSLYRNQEINKNIWDKTLTPFCIEGEIVRRAKRFLHPSASNIEMLTELRHYGQELALLDFTRSLYVALFFACSEYQNDPGELVILKSIKPKEEIVYGNLRAHRVSQPLTGIEPFSASLGRNRVLAQSSFFIRTPKGYIDVKEHGEDRISIIPIPAAHKEGIKNHLEMIHDIKIERIYSDLIGFVNRKVAKDLLNEQNNDDGYLNPLSENSRCLLGDKPAGRNERNGSKNSLLSIIKVWNRTGKWMELDGADFSVPRIDKKLYAKAYKYLIEGRKRYYSGDFDTTSDIFSKAKKLYKHIIEVRPNDPIAWNYLGYIHHLCGKYEDAMFNYNQSIEKMKNYSYAYSNRGITRLALGEKKEEIGLLNEAENEYLDGLKDFDEALKSNRQLDGALINKGLAKGKLGELNMKKLNIEKSIDWFSAAIKDLDLLIKNNENKTKQNEETAKAFLNRALFKELLGNIRFYNKEIISASFFYENAIIDYKAARALFESLPMKRKDIYQIASSFLNQGITESKLTQFDFIDGNVHKAIQGSEIAIENLSSAIKIFKKIQDAIGKLRFSYETRSSVSSNLAKLCSLIGKNDRAQEWTKRANDDLNEASNIKI